MRDDSDNDDIWARVERVAGRGLAARSLIIGAMA